jgi:type I restriction enzyme S subunit
VTAARERLAKAPAILKRFRQAVLAAACSGRLTADWREKHTKDDGWQTVQIRDIGRVTGGITKNARRPSLSRQVPYLRVANVYENRLELGEVYNIGVTTEEYNRTVLERGDLLFVEGNGSIDQIGRAAIWDGSISGCVHQNHLIRFRPSSRVLSEYLLIWMMSVPGREQLTQQAISSAGLHSLSITKIASAEIGLATLPEQSEIVRRVDALFKLADAIEQRLSAASRQVDKLTQAVLAKAFRGELVPTEAELARAEGRDYEPASVLLDRVRAERSAASKPPRAKRRKS